VSRSRMRTAIALGGAVLALERASSAADKGCEVKKSEVKVAVDGAKIEDALSKLGLSGKPDEARAIYFFDTCDLKLASAHVILRSRASEDGDGAKTTAKIRQPDEPQVPPDLCANVKCEEDRSGATTAATSCSLDRDVAAGEIATAVAAGGAIAKLFSTEQLTLVGLGRTAPPWGEMRALGPIASRTWKDVDIGSGSDATQVTIEEWTLPGQSKAGLLEVSQRVKRADAQHALDALETTLKKLGVALAAEQGPKTRATLEEISRDPRLCPAKSH
jgi:hypothetical protein